MRFFKNLVTKNYMKHFLKKQNTEPDYQRNEQIENFRSLKLEYNKAKTKNWLTI